MAWRFLQEVGARQFAQPAKRSLNFFGHKWQGQVATMHLNRDGGRGTDGGHARHPPIIAKAFDQVRRPIDDAKRNNGALRLRSRSPVRVPAYTNSDKQTDTSKPHGQEMK